MALAPKVDHFRNGRIEDGRGSLGPMANAPFPIPKGRTMLRKLLGAAAMAATAYAFVPAHAGHVHQAAHLGVGCSGNNFAKAEGGVETMADGPAKFMAERKIAQAQDAMLSGKMSGCAMHLSRALRAETVAQTPYPGTMALAPFASTAPQAPAETTQEAPPQPQGNWTPMKGAYQASAEGPDRAAISKAEQTLRAALLVASL